MIYYSLKHCFSLIYLSSCLLFHWSAFIAYLITNEHVEIVQALHSRPKHCEQNRYAQHHLLLLGWLCLRN